MRKLARIAGLTFALAAAALPAFANRPCSCNYCQSVAPTTVCNSGGPTTCGDWLAVTLCPPVG